MGSCNTIGDRIRSLREEKGYTQAQLAKKLFVKRETINQWENGARDLKTEYTIKLADIFDVTCDFLLRGVSAENVDVNKRLGLSDETIEVLGEYKDLADKGNKQEIDFINFLFSSFRFEEVVSYACEASLYALEDEKLQLEIKNQTEVVYKNTNCETKEHIEIDESDFEPFLLRNFEKQSNDAYANRGFRLYLINKTFENIIEGYIEEFCNKNKEGVNNGKYNKA